MRGERWKLRTARAEIGKDAECSPLASNGKDDYLISAELGLLPLKMVIPLLPARFCLLFRI